MTRTEVLQQYINQTGTKNYLEIGLGDGRNFNRIKCENKAGVDPCDNGSWLISDTETRSQRHVVIPQYEMTSDEFFQQNDIGKFGVIMIDGMHLHEYVYRDILNSLDVLEEDGYIVCHDMNPTSRKHQFREEVRGKPWNGDCWKAWVKLRSERSDLNMFVIDTDYGLGVISRGSQDTLNVTNKMLTYDNLDKNRRKWLNLISVEEFKNI